MDGQVNGTGKMIWTGGKKIYEGSWLSGKRHGKGIYEKKGQFKLTADYVDNKANGSGTVEFEGGFKYQGQLREGRQHGYGIATFPDGRTQEGHWREGKLMKEKQGILDK